VALAVAVLILMLSGFALQSALGWLLGGLASLCVRLIVVFVRILTLH